MSEVQDHQYKWTFRRAKLHTFWATEDITFPKFQNVKGAQSMRVDGVPGTSLKTMTEVMGFTIVNTAIEITPGKPDKKLFKMPKGYEVKEFDPNVFGGMGG